MGKPKRDGKDLEKSAVIARVQEGRDRIVKIAIDAENLIRMRPVTKALLREVKRVVYEYEEKHYSEQSAASVIAGLFGIYHQLFGIHGKMMQWIKEFDEGGS